MVRLLATGNLADVCHIDFCNGLDSGQSDGGEIVVRFAENLHDVRAFCVSVLV